LRPWDTLDHFDRLVQNKRCRGAGYHICRTRAVGADGQRFTRSSYFDRPVQIGRRRQTGRRPTPNTRVRGDIATYYWPSLH